MHERLKELKKALGLIGNIDSEDLCRLVSTPPPNDPVSLQKEKSASQNPFAMETSNKEHPYLFVYRDLELDKDINPIYSFRFVSGGLSPETNKVYLGSFGSQEVLEVLGDLKKTSPKPKKQKWMGLSFNHK